MLAEGNQLQEDAKVRWKKRTNSYFLVYTYVQPILKDEDPDFKQENKVRWDQRADSSYFVYKYVPAHSQGRGPRL